MHHLRQFNLSRLKHPKTPLDENAVFWLVIRKRGSACRHICLRTNGGITPTLNKAIWCGLRIFQSPIQINYWWTEEQTLLLSNRWQRKTDWRHVIWCGIATCFPRDELIWVDKRLFYEAWKRVQKIMVKIYENLQNQLPKTSNLRSKQWMLNTNC